MQDVLCQRHAYKQQAKVPNIHLQQFCRMQGCGFLQYAVGHRCWCGCGWGCACNAFCPGTHSDDAATARWNERHRCSCITLLTLQLLQVSTTCPAVACALAVGISVQLPCPHVPTHAVSSPDKPMHKTTDASARHWTGLSRGIYQGGIRDQCCAPRAADAAAGAHPAICTRGAVSSRPAARAWSAVLWSADHADSDMKRFLKGNSAECICCFARL